MNRGIDILEVDRIVAEIGRDEASVIPVLQAGQKTFKGFGYHPGTDRGGVVILLPVPA